MTNSFFRVNTKKLIKGAARLLIAASSQNKPAKIADVIDISGTTTLYDVKTGWTDLGSTRQGIIVEVNNTESVFDIDQISGDVLTVPDVWECFVSTRLAEITVENMALIWEGAAVTTDNTVTPNEKQTGFAGATAYTERRMAVLFRDAIQSNGITAYFFWRAVRSPQASNITYTKGGDAITLETRFRILADDTQVDPLTAFFIVRQQTSAT